MRRYGGILLALVLLLTAASIVFIYPTFGWRPWQLGLDLVGGSHLVYDVDLSEVTDADRSIVLEGLRDRIERRANPLGVSEPQVFVARSGEATNLVVELAGVDVATAIQRIGETPLLDFREVEEQGSSTVFIPTNLTGRYVENAQLTFNQTTQEPEVSIAFKGEGVKLFEQLTEKNVGKALAIFLDGQPISVPTVQQKISGGQAVITGNFTREEAAQLVARFRDGALPVPVKLISQETISPTLGLNSLRSVIFAGGIGTLLVMIFMLFYYGYLGVFAVFALLVYVVLTLALFKIIPITLSLSGIAGFVLTIGMAVDANILIFERAKEEIKKGLSKTTAVAEGFRRAWPSIRDSNVSTLITAVILYYFTSSFIRGFALTLLLGVLMSMFSAITVTRLFLQTFFKDKRTHV